MTDVSDTLFDIDTDFHKDLELTSFQPESSFAETYQSPVDNLNKPLSDEVDGEASLLNALMNTLNSILGAGLIAIPMSFSYVGLMGVAVILPFTVLVMDFTMRLIVKNLKISQSKTYQQSVEYTMGNVGKFIILFGNGMFALGGCISFLIIIGDTLPHVLVALMPRFATFLKSRSFTILVCGWFVCFPLALHRDIGKLGGFSTIAFISMGFIVLSVIIKGPFLNTDYRAEGMNLTFKQYGFNFRKIVKGMSIINFAMICHHNTAMIFQSLKNKANFNKLIHLSTIISGLVIFIIGIAGFLIFQGKLNSNILNNFPEDDVLINISRALFAFNMITTYPLEVFVLREVIRDLINFNKSEVIELSDTQHFGITFAISLMSTLVATQIENLGSVLELVGSYAGSLMAFILPPLVNILLNPERSNKENIKYYIVIGLGAFLIIYSTYELFV